MVKRVVRVGGDALSIKDIIRALKNDPERTEQLKAIIMRTDIDDAKNYSTPACPPVLFIRAGRGRPGQPPERRDRETETLWCG